MSQFLLLHSYSQPLTSCSPLRTKAQQHTTREPNSQSITWPNHSVCVIARVCSHAKRMHTPRGHACSSAHLIVCTHKSLPRSGHVSRTADLNDHVCVCSSLLVRHAWADPSWPEGRERLSPLPHAHTRGVSGQWMCRTLCRLLFVLEPLYLSDAFVFCS